MKCHVRSKVNVRQHVLQESSKSSVLQLCSSVIGFGFVFVAFFKFPPP